MLLQSVSLVMTALVVSFYYSWLLTLITSLGLLFIVLFYFFTIPRLVKMMKEVEHADRMSSSIASEVFTSIRMVAACGAEGKMARKYSSWVRESRRRGLLMSPVVAIQQSPGKDQLESPAIDTMLCAPQSSLVQMLIRTILLGWFRSMGTPIIPWHRQIE